MNPPPPTPLIHGSNTPTANAAVTAVTPEDVQAMARMYTGK